MGMGRCWQLLCCHMCTADITRSDSLEPDYYTQNMSLLCPLDDEHLPMEAANLKTRQVKKPVAVSLDTAEADDAAVWGPTNRVDLC